MRARALRALLLCTATAAGAQSPAKTLVAHSEPQAPRVVFVCEHGSVKCLVAASYFNRGAQSRGLTDRDNLPGVLSDYARGRDAILKQVDSLLDELAAEPHRER